MATMMALRAHARGGAEQLAYEQAPAPVPGPGDALVAVHEAAITFAELTWDLSWTGSWSGPDRAGVLSHGISTTAPPCMPCRASSRARAASPSGRRAATSTVSEPAASSMSR